MSAVIWEVRAIPALEVSIGKFSRPSEPRAGPSVQPGVHMDRLARLGICVGSLRDSDLSFPHATKETVGVFTKLVPSIELGSGGHAPVQCYLRYSEFRRSGSWQACGW